MKGMILFLTLVLLLLHGWAEAANLPSITHYKLDMHFALADQRVTVVATMSIRNSTDQTHTTLPFLLYRLLTVGKVSDGTGDLPFKQIVGQLRDEPLLQANEINVELLHPLKPNDSTTIVMTYSGYIFGYPEVMAYVKDRIDEDYSLIRPDAFAYPQLAEPTFASALAANDTKFTYEVSATVPKGHHGACGGELVGSRTDADSSIFTYRSKVRTWRIDVAVAKFTVLSNPADKLVVYSLPDDTSGAKRVLDASKNVISMYGKWFGLPTNFAGYTIIEIPDGWGSQASDYYFLQTAAAFKDSSRIPEVYHEIGHSWNATASGDVQRCRYFDEAFASFYEALAIRTFDGEKAFAEEMESSKSQFSRRAQSDPLVFDTPIAGYGVKELGRHSYTKGAWSLYVLYEIVGEKTFTSIIRAMLTEFDSRTIDFDQFEKLCSRIAGRDLHKFFQEWIYGIESSRLMTENVPIAEIVRRYAN